MNPLNINHIKVEKANSIKLRYQKIRKITQFFRVFEIFLVLAVISRFSFQLPINLTFKLSTEYFHNLSLILISPQFVFIIGNAIVIILFINSGQFNTQFNVKTLKTPPHDHKNIKSQAKIQRVKEENTIMATIFASQDHQMIKTNYHRSKSSGNILRRINLEKNCGGLKRSNTEMKSLKGSIGCRNKDVGKNHYPEDRMSSEEFRRTIEDFIAKQQRLLRQEEAFDNNFYS